MQVQSEAPSKASVAALQEYLMKKGQKAPIYEFDEQLENGTKSFRCTLTVEDEMTEGIGRSKREAKHEAADNVLKKLKVAFSDVKYTPQSQMPIVDAVTELRFLCLQNNHPFPVFEAVQEIGPPSPEFMTKCSVASVVRYGVSSTKKWSRQLAAQQLIDIIQAIPCDGRFDDIVKRQDDETRSKFKLYKETVESDAKDQPGTLLSERHNYFKNLQPALKEKARTILNERIYSDEDKVDLILKELDINYKKSSIPCSTGGNMVFIELLCDIDVVFANVYESIFDEIISYFNVML